MKIIFFCGTLEPGKDGVGDYSRRLAVELLKQGYSCMLISLHDKYVKVEIKEKQEADGIGVTALRIPKFLKRKVKMLIAKQEVDKFDPDWLSLQYVPFSFHKRGIPWGLAADLEKLGKGKKWQIMFHELWVGMDVESSLKIKIWGKAQQYLIKKTLYRLKPAVINTQSNLYRAQLENLGYKAEIIPLFSNIPVLSGRLVSTKNGFISFVVFGLIHPGAPIKEFVQEVATYSRKINKEVRFTFIGRCGEELGNWRLACEEMGFKTRVLGEQNPEKISEVLSESDWGISSTPFFQIEKSGTVAAMREHDLPVYAVSRHWNPQIGFSFYPEGIRKYIQNKLDLDIPIASKTPKNHLQNVGQLFFNNLTS